MSLAELAGACAAITAVLAALGSFVVWLVWPRLRDSIESVVEAKLRPVSDKLEDTPGTVGRHAKVAAAAASELPAIRADLERLSDRQRAVDDWRERVDRRLLMVEEITLALVGPELRRRMLADLETPLNTPTESESPS